MNTDTSYNSIHVTIQNITDTISSFQQQTSAFTNNLTQTNYQIINDNNNKLTQQQLSELNYLFNNLSSMQIHISNIYSDMLRNLRDFSI